MRAASLVAVIVILLAGGLPAIFFAGELHANLSHAGDYQAGLHDGAGWLSDVSTSFNNIQAALISHEGLAGYCAVAKANSK